MHDSAYKACKEENTWVVVLPYVDAIQLCISLCVGGKLHGLAMLRQVAHMYLQVVHLLNVQKVPARMLFLLW